MPVNPIGLKPETLEALGGQYTDVAFPQAGDVAASAGIETPGHTEGSLSQSTGFAKLLADAINDVNQVQAGADRQAQLLATGEAENPHDAVIAIEKADLALELTVKVTEKALGAYKQISQMQL
jgi:flagellar hook-basal body complex protein FliE